MAGSPAPAPRWLRPRFPGGVPDTIFDEREKTARLPRFTYLPTYLFLPNTYIAGERIWRNAPYLQRSRDLTGA